MDICAIIVLLFSIPISSFYAHYTTPTITPFHDKYIYIYGILVIILKVMRYKIKTCYSVIPYIH
jgi:hypothetical protein